MDGWGNPHPNAILSGAMQPGPARPGLSPGFRCSRYTEVEVVVAAVLKCIEYMCWRVQTASVLSIYLPTYPVQSALSSPPPFFFSSCSGEMCEPVGEDQ